MLGSNDRRKISTIVLNPGALFRLSIPFLILITFSIATIMLIHWQVLETMARNEFLNRESAAALVALNEIVGRIMITGMYGMTILCLSCFGLWLVYSHRIFGPAVPIRRHIQNLKAGDYKSRINLRPNDEFGDIALELNQLAEALEAQKESLK